MITKQVYSTFDMAYAFFNKELFEGKLPDSLITLQRKSRSRGHFGAERFQERVGGGKTAELNLNPDYFVDRTDTEILSTLVHEQTHVEQQTFGTPSRGGYHNKQWASMMEKVGLMPSSTEKEGGSKTGQNMSHYIIEGGAFDIACKKFLKNSGLEWESVVYATTAGQSKKTRWKFTCPECQQNAWAKEEASLGCGDCKCSLERED